MFGRRKLNKGHKSLAVQVSKDAYARANGDKAVYEQLVKADPRNVGMDPMLVLLFIKLAMAIFDYFKNRQVSASAVAAEDEDAVILGAVKNYRG